jgi:hypothetical protein
MYFALFKKKVCLEVHNCPVIWYGGSRLFLKKHVSRYFLVCRFIYFVSHLHIKKCLDT